MQKEGYGFTTSKREKCECFAKLKFSLFVQIHLVAEYGFQVYSTFKVISTWQIQRKHIIEIYN